MVLPLLVMSPSYLLELVLPLSPSLSFSLKTLLLQPLVVPLIPKCHKHTRATLDNMLTSDLRYHDVGSDCVWNVILTA